jgi:hypothetical protein
VSVNPIFPDVFQGGQMTDLPAFTGTLNGTEVMEIVAAPTGQSNAAAGVNYQITSSVLADLLADLAYNLTIVTSGATYNSVASDTYILINKTVGSVTTVALLDGSLYTRPILIKDLKGDADVNPITITFPGTYDGIAGPVTINTAFGSVWFNPLPTGNFYAS